MSNLNENIETVDTEEMESQNAGTPTESSNLVPPSGARKINSLNLISNICTIIFVIIITYLSFSKESNLFSFHPMLMSFGWLLLMTSGINSISPGDFATEWMPTSLRSRRHWIIQSMAVVLIVAGFFVIVANKIIKNKNHFVTVHAIIGLISTIFLVLTATGGLGALYSMKFKAYLAPVNTKLIHGFAGLLTFLLGMVTIILGLYSSWWSFGDFLRYSCFLLVLIIMLLTVLRPGLKIYFRLKERITLVRNN